MTATEAARSRHGIDTERFRLRTFLAGLAGSDELQVHDAPIDLVDVAAVADGNPKAILFRSVGPEGAELAGNVTGSRERLARAFGVPAGALLGEVSRRLRIAPRLVEVARAEAPVQQVVRTGDDADITRLPIHLQHGYDGAPYVSASIDYVLDHAPVFYATHLWNALVRGPASAPDTSEPVRGDAPAR